MRKAIAILLIVIGAVWAGQGSGYFPYPSASFMIGQSLWILIGAAFVIAGLIVLLAPRRR